MKEKIEQLEKKVTELEQQLENMRLINIRVISLIEKQAMQHDSLLDIVKDIFKRMSL